jgi:hypothetical protein
LFDVPLACQLTREQMCCYIFPAFCSQSSRSSRKRICNKLLWNTGLLLADNWESPHRRGSCCATLPTVYKVWNIVREERCLRTSGPKKDKVTESWKMQHEEVHCL